MKVVIGWPIIAGLRCCEYKRYFKWAKRFKNYHPDITEEIFWVNDHHTVRYETETYDERVSSCEYFVIQSGCF